MWKNTVQGTDDNITRRMCFACWTNKATGTHSEYVILTALSQQWSGKRTSIFHYTYFASLVNFAIRLTSAETCSCFCIRNKSCVQTESIIFFLLLHRACCFDYFFNIPTHSPIIYTLKSTKFTLTSKNRASYI